VADGLSARGDAQAAAMAALIRDVT